MDAVLDEGAVLKELGWLENDLAQAWNFKGMLDTGWFHTNVEHTFKERQKGDPFQGPSVH